MHASKRVRVLARLPGTRAWKEDCVLGPTPSKNHLISWKTSSLISSASSSVDTSAEACKEDEGMTLGFSAISAGETASDSGIRSCAENEELAWTWTAPKTKSTGSHQQG